MNGKPVAAVVEREDRIDGFFSLSPTPKSDAAYAADAGDLLLACQAWATQLKRACVVWLASPTRSGGLGFEGAIDSLYFGAVTGFLKAMRREFPELAVKVGSSEESVGPHLG